MAANMTIDPGASRIARLRLGARDLLCDLRQWQYPPEFRIARPAAPEVTTLPPEPDPSTAPVVAAIPAEDPAAREQSARLDRAIAKVAVCLWDIRRRLEGSEAVGQDRKLRQLPRRAEAAVTALEDLGVEIDDPIGRPYRTGSEGMNPKFLPTPGATEETIIETIAPIVYRDDRLIGRGDVFVATPAPIESEPRPGAMDESNTAIPTAAAAPPTVGDTPAPAGEQPSGPNPSDGPAAGAPAQGPDPAPIRNEGH